MIVDYNSVRAAQIVLASSSPRRVEILNGILTLGAVIVPSTFPEDLDKRRFTPKEYVVENARQKALEVYTRLAKERSTPPSLVVGADTVVVNEDRILEKPKDADAAKEMLASLSGSSHEVATGVALVYPPRGGSGEPEIVTFVETTCVDFADLSASVIDTYVASGEPFDKAGGYGIQCKAGAFVTGIRGCYWNVVGFPMHRFCATLDCDRLREWTEQHGGAGDATSEQSSKRHKKD